MSGYRAFFSYARADDRIANWLHRQLDAYRTPKGLVGSDGALGPVPAKLHPIFRDRTDLQAGGHIDQALQQALEDSETLVVLCTPTSAKSQWVNHECETFLRLGRTDRIFPVIAAGEPDSKNPNTECFPPALRGSGLLAADLREIKRPNGQLIGDGREGGRLKLIAGLLGVPLDALARRERRRQRQVTAALGAAALIFLGVAIFAGFQTFEARTTLHRFFAERAWASYEQGDYPAAARYALAGMRLAPQNGHLYRAALAGAMHQAVEGGPALEHEGGIVTATFSPDGARVLVASAEAAKMWGARDGRLIATLSGHRARVTVAEFSTDGARVVTASNDAAKVWDARNGRLMFTVQGHDLPVVDAAFSPDGAHILTAGEDHFVRISDARNGRLVTTLQGHGGPVGNAVFSPDGRLIATMQGHRGLSAGHLFAPAAAPTPGVRRVSVVEQDDTAKVWTRDGRLIATLSGHEGGPIPQRSHPMDGASSRSARTASPRSGSRPGASFSQSDNQLTTPSLRRTAHASSLEARAAPPKFGTRATGAGSSHWANRAKMRSEASPSRRTARASSRRVTTTTTPRSGAHATGA